MKLLKLLVLGLFALTLASCSDDDDNNVLRYSKTEVNDFKLWRGSENGGKEISTSNMSVKELFPDEEEYEYITGIQDEVKDVTIEFTDDQYLTIHFLGQTSTSLYTFEDEILYLIDIEDGNEDFEVLGYGDKNNLIVKFSFIHLNKNGNDHYEDNDERHYTLADGLELMYLESLSEMTNETDMIAIYNFTVTFRK